MYITRKQMKVTLLYGIREVIRRQSMNFQKTTLRTFLILMHQMLMLPRL